MIVRRGSPMLGGAGAGLFPLVARLLGSRFGVVGILLAVGAFFLINYFGSAPTSQVAPSAEVAERGTGDQRVEFVSFVLDDVQDTWQKIFAQRGDTYERAKLVIFADATTTACGFGQAATGPFYCPRDNMVYLDLSFFRDLERRFAAPGDFAQAYVIAHEIGHHVQNQLGLAERTSREGSVRVELQADCFAGVWAKTTSERALLEQGDLTEALEAAAAVGDDRLQRQSTGTVQPESWTHGSSAQRTAWFKRGYESGNPTACDTSRNASR